MTIKNNFEISLDKFINFALYDKKKGYYMQKSPFGRKGDFITAPNISRMFSEMIAIWILGFWENLGNPKKIKAIHDLIRFRTEIHVKHIKNHMFYGNLGFHSGHARVEDKKKSG